jgi:hypothetical protein
MMGASRRTPMWCIKLASKILALLRMLTLTSKVACAHFSGSRSVVVNAGVIAFVGAYAHRSQGC